MDYKIRNATIQDLDAIRELSVHLSKKESDEFDPTIDPEWNKSTGATEYFEKRIQEDSGFAVIAEDDENTVGYIIGGIEEAEDYRQDLKIAELETMYVRPEYRSEGIGTAFIEKFENWAEEYDADRMRVEVTSQNEDGIRFYAKNGFDDYAKIMEKDL